ncbi:alpha/beta hydrolase family protein [Candidatus Nitrospira neomarina]|uniref:Palmitoyl-protein thioesterase ABHD10, mitochondrial n=1 Tax=Candidatus Nitrospira neomarina TaxID=3020899 RepID=A0AA96GR82_9BACT|nr:alpha/beta fold hydrolase [Candidatus Nitrospira neomarina]WNM62081.1 alpha/beta fold hydrolase [Candidatus Nitrospira neomarina]
MARPTTSTFCKHSQLVETASPTESWDGRTEASVSFTGSSGIVTTGIFAQPAASTHRAVILCHGFPSDKNSRTNRRLTDLLIPQSIATLRFDWYGMGDSPEPLSQLRIQKCEEQLDAAVRFLTERSMKALGLIGSSFGGFMAILSAPRYPLLQALGLKCPVVDFSEVLRLELGADAMDRWKRTDHIPDVFGGELPTPLPYAFFEECLTYNGYNSASRIQAPTLIVHGDQDEIIPVHQIDRLLTSLNVPKDFRLIPGANHQFGRPEDFRLMTTHLAKWMIAHLPLS